MDLTIARGDLLPLKSAAGGQLKVAGASPPGMSLTFEPAGRARAAELLRQEDKLGRNPSKKEDHMIKGLMLLMLAALLFQACADTNSDSRYRDRDSMIDRANLCATCGASVSDGYFGGSAFKAIGPGNY